MGSLLLTDRKPAFLTDGKPALLTVGKPAFLTVGKPALMTAGKPATNNLSNNNLRLNNLSGVQGAQGAREAVREQWKCTERCGTMAVKEHG